LTVCFDNPQRVGYGVRDDRCDEADEGEAEEPDEEGVFGGCGDGFGEEVVLDSDLKSWSRLYYEGSEEHTVANQG
jgi:hypothetical protein